MFADAKNQKRTASATSTIDTRQKFAHMCGRGSVTFAAIESIKNLLQFISAGNDDADADGSQVKQKAEIIQISIKERVLVVPFDFYRNSIFEAVNLVGW